MQIEVKNVTKKYGDFYAVRNINFEIKDGEIIEQGKMKDIIKNKSLEDIFMELVEND